MDALAPPQRGEQARREGATLNHMVGGHPLSHCEKPSSQAEGQSSRTPPEYREVIHSDLNVALAKETHSTRVVEVDSDSQPDPWQTPLLYLGSLSQPL